MATRDGGRTTGSAPASGSDVAPGRAPIPGSRRDGDQLVLHVIPTATARGAQREARALADRLDALGPYRHRVLCLFGGQGDVVVDVVVAASGGRAPGVGFDPRLPLRLRSVLGHLRPAAVVAYGGEALKYLVPAMIGSDVPLAYHAIGTVAPVVHRPVRRRVWRALVRRADVVAAVGEEVAEECRDLLGVPVARLVLAPNGRDPEEFRPAAGPTRRPVPVLTFVGALSSGKRPEVFVALVEALRAQGVACRAQVAGDGPLRDALVGPAGAADVTLLGPRRDVADLLGASDVVVFPSLPEGEGLPGVLIEAGMSGVPVVATAVPGVRQVVSDGQTGVVVGVDDFDALVQATTALLRDPERRAAMGQAARARCVALFGLDTVARAWSAFLEPLVTRA